MSCHNESNVWWLILSSEGLFAVIKISASKTPEDDPNGDGPDTSIFLDNIDLVRLKYFYIFQRKRVKILIINKEYLSRHITILEI